MSEEIERIGFSYQAFESLVRRFAATVPQLLAGHPETAELALQIEKLRPMEALESRFTVAIIGQMRIGKSTLLNALIGRQLAPTGVKETTATINWFRHGTGDLCEKFRVHWLDGSTNDYPLGKVEKWVGNEDNAKKTRALDFFADSEFLNTANIVDTPGTRSVLEHHEDTTQGFLAEKLEAETLRHGGRADAVIYVINPVAKETDRDLLQFFGERPRLPGASAYNSIAVVQKWEHLTPDPVVEAEKKCQRLRDQFQGRIAEVFPVSGLLANLAMGLSDEAWADIAALATQSTPEAIKKLLLTESFFCRDIPEAALDIPSRTVLTQCVEWPALRFCIPFARSRQIDEGRALRQAVLEVSGIERLKSTLQTRFFSLAGLIKASTVLRKAWDPCDIALLKLRDLAERCQQDLKLAARSEDILRTLSQRHADLADVLTYVNRSRSAVEHEQQQVDEIRHQLDRIKHQAAANFQFLDDDIACLQYLETGSAGELSSEERAELYRLFGGQGPDVWDRLGLSVTTPRQGVEDYLWDRHDYWLRRKQRASGDLLKICAHATTCLGKMLDFLEDEADA